jgi:branched-chain amino acid transport system permease protein
LLQVRYIPADQQAEAEARSSMQPRPFRIIALLFAAVTAVLATVSGPAVAAIAPHAASQSCVKPAPRQDESIHFQGCLTDTRKKPPAPVPDVKISIKDSSGKVVGTGTSNKTGIFDIPLPGTATDNLGKTFSINIDTKSLPEGAALRNPKQVSLKQRITLDSDVYVTFPIGPSLITDTSELTQALQLAVGGLVFSMLLAMASLGLSMIFGTTGLTNFAHGELITFGAIVAFGIDSLPGNITLFGANVTMVTAIAVAVIASTFFGWFQDKVLWKKLRRRGTGLIAAMIVSIGLSIFLRNVYQYVAGADNHNYSQWTSPAPWQIGSILITPKDVGVLVFSALVLVLVSLAVQRTQIGKATRAVADNPALAASSGINVDRVISVVWSVGAGLAGLSGVLLGMTQGFDYQIGFKILLLVFAAVILGGLGSVWGALLGSFIIGIFIEVSTLVIPAELKFVGALVVLILVLLVRPQGLLGRAERVG